MGFYNIQNKTALNATGGKTAGFGMTVATLQLGVGTIYSFLIWIVGYNLLPICGFVKPSVQKLPQLGLSDLIKMLPVAFCSAAAHSASVLSLNAGSVTFAQIVKAGEPVFAALVNTLLYNKAPSLYKWLCLPIVIGGVVFSCMKPDPVSGSYSIEYDMTSLTMASVANIFAAIKGAENARLMQTKGLKDRIGGFGNQVALTEVLGFFISLPVMFYLEGDVFPKFCDMFTMTIKKTSAVTGSVANTAKRVIVMVVSAIVFGEALTFEKKLGSAVAIGGVFLYSVIDELMPKKKPADKIK